MGYVRIRRKTTGATGPPQEEIKKENVSHVTHFITESRHRRQIRYDEDTVSRCVGVIFRKQEEARHNTTWMQAAHRVDGVVSEQWAEERMRPGSWIGE